MVHKVNETLLEILALFTAGYRADHHIREVERLCGMSSRSALLALARLEQMGVLTSRMRGRNKTYGIRRSFLSREYFVLAEHYKKVRFLERHPIAAEVLEKADTAMEGIVAVFGSYAKGEVRQGSDLDLFIVGTHDRSKIRRIGKIYGLPVDVKAYPLHMFEKGDILTREIADSHVLIKGALDFVRRMVPWTSSSGARNNGMV